MGSGKHQPSSAALKALTLAADAVGPQEGNTLAVAAARAYAGTPVPQSSQSTHCSLLVSSSFHCDVPVGLRLQLSSEALGEGTSAKVVLAELPPVQAAVSGSTPAVAGRHAVAAKVFQQRPGSRMPLPCKTSTPLDAAAREAMPAPLLAAYRDYFAVPLAGGCLESSGESCLVYDLYQGTLADRLQQEGPSSAAEVQDTMRQLLQCADILHEQLRSHSIMHRDIKPANILVDGHGKLVLGDFGSCAVDVKHLGSSQSVQHGVPRGSPLYEAPEIEPWSRLYELATL